MRSTPCKQPPLWLHPKAVALSTPQVNVMAEATAVLTAAPEPGGTRAGKGNERRECREARREPAQRRRSDKGPGL